MMMLPYPPYHICVVIFRLSECGAHKHEVFAIQFGVGTEKSVEWALEHRQVTGDVNMVDWHAVEWKIGMKGRVRTAEWIWKIFSS